MEGSKGADAYIQVPYVELIKLKFIAKRVLAEPGVLAYTETSKQLLYLINYQYSITSCQIGQYLVFGD